MQNIIQSLLYKSNQTLLEQLGQGQMIYQQFMTEVIDYLQNHLESLQKSKLRQLFSSNSSRAKQIQQEIEKMQIKAKQNYKNFTLEIKKLAENQIDYIQQHIMKEIEQMKKCNTYTQQQIDDLKDILNQIVKLISKTFVQEHGEYNSKLVNYHFFANAVLQIGSIGVYYLFGLSACALVGSLTALIGVFQMEHLDEKYRNKIQSCIDDVKQMKKKQKVEADNELNLVKEQLQQETNKIIMKVASSFQSEECILWLDQNISSSENRQYCQKIQDSFPNKIFCFTHNKEEFIQHLKQSSVAYIIISGSYGKQMMKDLLLYSGIKTIIVFCYDIEIHKWAMDYQIVAKVVNVFQDVIQVLSDLVNQHTLIGACQLRQFPNFLKKNSIYYLSKEFSEKGLSQKTSVDALSIVNDSLKQYPERIKQKYFQFLTSKELKILENQIKFALQNNQEVNDQIQIQKRIKEIIKLYTYEGPFYKMLNTILNILNQEQIDTYSQVIKLMRYALFNYNDRQKEIFSDKQFRLYRGINFDPSLFKKQNRINEVFIFPAFTSTTPDFEIAKQFSQQNKLVIEISFDEKLFGKDFNMLRPKKILAEDSYYPSENEFLFPCFSAFLILGYIEKNGYTIAQTRFIDLSETNE
ncbi:transmembrane protein, putative (macronuclear) [Tetrahymena thermophila SB210]|uniref:Transmembrane protein, putative n=1 Tax=Tetrahymena thermophila (strain SB210) TaxID=312017 RepID=Q22WH3_TETTS|nr:transmembrane protein, putative [Tetrahymena thermophila SB210]EAR89444.2 transmembrane protein, putative [Tetrahymena thermophila SB210]|eukprot:XP_001009689.2 transmembrane protein, putative [Tetrahymena thermophila SB210]